MINLRYVALGPGLPATAGRRLISCALDAAAGKTTRRTSALKTRTHRLAKAALAPYTAMSVHSFYVGPGYPPVRISQWAT
jgi:hypothetical protein